MKNRKSFLKGALCGALAMLLAAGLVSCGLKVNSGSSDITSKTEDKISELQNLVKKHYMGDVKEKNLDRKSTRLNSSHRCTSRMPSSA